MIPGPLFIIGAPLVIAPIAYLLRRVQAIAALVTGLTTLLLAWVSYWLPLDRPAQLGRLVVDLGQALRLFDRPLVIEANDRPVLAFIFLVATALFWFAWRVDQGPLFFPLGLVLLSLFSAVVLMQPFQYAALLLTFAAAISAFLIQGSRPGHTQAALRYLVLAVIALPPILVAGWELEKFVDTPDEVSLLRIAAVLFACTFAVLLASVPFHSWVPAVGADAPPLVAALIFTAGQSVVVAWMLSLFAGRPQLLLYLDAYQLLSWAGLGMVAVGTLLAFSRASFGRLMGYAALIDMGALLLALGLGDASGLQAALLTLALRALGLVLSSAGLSVLRTQAGGDLFEQVRGLGWRLPFASAALVLGGLSLAGFPLTPGFVGRWALLRLLAQRDPTYAFILFVAGISVAVGYMRGLGALLAPPPAPARPAPEEAPADAPDAVEPALALGTFDAAEGEAIASRRPAARRPRLRWPPAGLPLWRPPFAEPLPTTVMLVIALAVSLVIAVAPQYVLPWVRQIAALYSFFGS